MFFTDRDVSWLKFNQRVLEQVERNIPLAEKLTFLGIAMDNLDEFLMSRYPRRLSFETLDITSDIVQHSKLINSTLSAINKKEMVLYTPEMIVDKEIKKEIVEYFEKKIFPLLYTKVISNKSLSPKSKEINIFVELHDEKKKSFIHSNISIPMNTPRFIYFSMLGGFMSLEDIIVMSFHKVFRGLNVIRHCVYMVTRSVNMIYNDENMDLYSMISKSLKSMNDSWITSVQCNESFSKKSFGRVLKEHLEIQEDTILLGNQELVGGYALKSISDKHFSDINQRRKSERATPFPNNISVFDIIKDRDRLVFHPFESFDNTVTKFIMDAAVDPDVMSIKMTLYRIPKESKIIDALLKATEMNKSVVVMVELKARFNERDNLNISRILKEAGVDIIYSDELLKTHAKMCIITRNEKDKVKIYSHVSTGNYSEVNSKIYTDYSYFTSSMSIGKDLTEFFNMLSNPSLEPFKSKEIIYAPHNLRDELKNLIKGQVKLAKDNKKAKIIIKCNSITDHELASELYKASNAGVDITLIVRGACIIKPGLPNMSKNIKVISIVGKYLEHSRVYMFGTKKDREIYIGSSDLMYRNLTKRYELLIKIDDEDMKERLSKHMSLYEEDTVNSHWLDDETYKKNEGKELINCHNEFEKEARKRSV